MRETRWRSMSIMDLNLTRRKSSGGSSGYSFGGGSAAAAAAGGGGSLMSSSAAVPISAHTGGGQSYELIKSTQVGQLYFFACLFSRLKNFC